MFLEAGAKAVVFLRRMAAVENYNPFESSRIRQLWFLRCVFVGGFVCWKFAGWETDGGQARHA